MTAKRQFLFWLSLAIVSGLLVPPLARLGISLSSDYYSHIPLIPLVSAYLLYLDGKAVFNGAVYAPQWGGPLVAVGLLLYTAGLWGPELSSHDAASLMVFSSLLVLYGSFVLLYGTHAFSRSVFPFLFLLFMVPIPGALMERIIYFLQVGSAEVTDLIFTAAGVPYLREGLRFHLPPFTIEVAKQCSGIRSSLALAITTVLAAHMLLGAGWQKMVLTASILPLVLIKNGIRISVLTFLGLYVDQRILVDGFLHKSGGIFFFIPVLIIMGIILATLRQIGRDRVPAKGGTSSAVAPTRSG